jgi:hypothetical protein
MCTTGVGNPGVRTLNQDSYQDARGLIFKYEVPLGGNNVDIYFKNNMVQATIAYMDTGDLSKYNPTGKLISTWAQVDPNDII